MTELLPSILLPCELHSMFNGGSAHSAMRESEIQSSFSQRLEGKKFRSSQFRGDDQVCKRDRTAGEQRATRTRQKVLHKSIFAALNSNNRSAVWGGNYTPPNASERGMSEEAGVANGRAEGSE